MTDPNHIAEARKKIGRPQIREAFLRNGASIPADRDDLPDWVYEATFELMESVIQSGQPAIQQTCDASFVDDYYGRVFDDTVSRAIGRIERSRK